ncbi:MAG: aminotransferase class I/II-fold pyridoxal phosphate-dependent enzyme, partial [Lentisphaeria bacterium]|nr:aminotransferase class I/II-fold pyridoxal phosphate-dependent enzyme [Lentisphaeria bacterium]
MSRDFQNRSRSRSGISQLMDDLGKAMSGSTDMLMLGGGNPAHIPEVQNYIREALERILATEGRFEQMIGNYDTPMGITAFRVAIAELFSNEYGWPITEKNIVLTNGSQSAFFALFNILAGDDKHILLPITPEYIGYADQGLRDDLFIGNKPEIEHLDNQQFKYHVDFETLSLDDSFSAICSSRPTNPTANVLSNAEMTGLLDLAEKHDIPFIIDNAYGTPFPNIIYTEADPFWHKNSIVCMSLSKFGLPSVRTGIVIADESL